MKFIIAFLLLFATTAFGQKADVQAEFTSVNGVDYNFNFVWNPSAYVNIRFTEPDGDAHRSRDTAAGKKLDNKASFLVDTTNINDQVQWEFRALSSEYTTGTCYAKGRYKGNASSVEAQVYNNTGVYPYVKVGGVLLTNATDWTDFGFLYPCAVSLSRSFRVMRTLTGSGAEIFNIGQIHVGKLPLPNLASVRISTNSAAYTPTLTNLGTGATSNLQWYQEGAFYYIDGTITCGTSPAASPAVSLPNSATTPSNIPTISARGAYYRGASSANHGGSVLVGPSSSTFTFSSAETFSNTASNPSVTSPGGICPTGETITLQGVKIPIAGATNQTAMTAQNWNFDWRACPGTLTGTWTGNVNYTCKWKRQGGDGFFDINVNTTGAPTPSSSLVLTFWSGLQFDTARLTAALSDSQVLMGAAGTAIDLSVNTYQVTPILYSATQFRPILWGAGGTFTAASSVNNTSPFTYGSGDIINMKFSAPIIENGVAWTETYNALQLNGSETNDLATAQRNVTLEFAGAATFSTNCTSSPCTIRNPSLAGMAVTRFALGTFDLTFPNGTWRSIDDYTCQPTLTNFSSPNWSTCYAIKQSATVIRFYCGQGSTSVDVAAVVKCWGPK